MHSMKSLFKAVLNAIARVLVWPCAVLCWLEVWFHPGREEWFSIGAQAFSLVPGTPGVYLRRAFYRYTLDYCAADCSIAFGSIFAHRKATVESGVYIGRCTLLGSVILRRKCLIGSRSSLLSGGHLHSLNECGEWSPADLSNLEQIEIGESAWLGEGVTVSANVGARAMVSAGAVVSAPVPNQVMVAGNPARFVKRLFDDKTESAKSQGMLAEQDQQRDESLVAKS